MGCRGYFRFGNAEHKPARHRASSEREHRDTHKVYFRGRVARIRRRVRMVRDIEHRLSRRAEQRAKRQRLHIERSEQRGSEEQDGLGAGDKRSRRAPFGHSHSKQQDIPPRFRQDPIWIQRREWSRARPLRISEEDGRED